MLAQGSTAIVTGTATCSSDLYGQVSNDLTAPQLVFKFKVIATLLNSCPSLRIMAGSTARGVAYIAEQERSAAVPARLPNLVSTAAFLAPANIFYFVLLPLCRRLSAQRG